MSKQDRQGVRTARDLERKYDFRKLTGGGAFTGAVPESISQLTQTLSQFITQTNVRFEEVESREGNAVMWVYNGIPTLLNKPAVDWTDDETKEQHIGDTYVDLDTGISYRFVFSEEAYEWEKIADDNYAIATNDKAGVVKGGDTVGVKEDGTLYIEFLTDEDIDRICTWE